jgi:hypothetical protein
MVVKVSIPFLPIVLTVRVLLTCCSICENKNHSGFLELKTNGDWQSGYKP